MSAKKAKAWKLKAIVILIVLAVIIYNLLGAYQAMVRTVRSVAQSRMEDVANTAIHLAIQKASEHTDYGKLVVVTRGEDGSIDSVALNAREANRLKSEIALGVLDYLDKEENYTISVPLGNFAGSEFLSGMGPDIDFKIIPANIAHIDFESSFKPAGINQVLHTLSVRVDVDISALLPGFEEISNLSSSAVVAETVIMGDVPETYLNIQK